MIKKFVSYALREVREEIFDYVTEQLDYLHDIRQLLSENESLNAMIQEDTEKIESRLSRIEGYNSVVRDQLDDIKEDLDQVKKKL